MCGFSVNTQTLLPDNKMSIFCFSEGLIIIGDMKLDGKVLEKRLSLFGFRIRDYSFFRNVPCFSSQESPCYFSCSTIVTYRPFRKILLFCKFAD